ncbi:hypothetical protein L873DRAFT_1701762, partial [Choiromyces venosus 120613-1]
YQVPGLDFVLSVDGHHKISEYGIEVYASIDSYLRYIWWVHVGIAARTGIAILKQYLNLIEDT